MAENKAGTVVFTINDIDLEIAPESISVQQEDLVYNWKTLRTRASTKIPSGHGQTMVQVRIPFMDYQILALHRLIVEFRHSPFCFIENLYLRQSLCPEWPLGQKMAFTMTGLDIVPYPGTTNAWIVNLEMTWFNYFPYVHNWLYRRDWTTEWISHKGDKAEPYYVKLTIGWDIDSDGNRKGPRTNIIDEKSLLTNDQVAHEEWSAVNDSYINKSLSIEDMELLHRGEIFDLLPIPSQMEKAFFVPQPGESLIYKRFINYLQRDALKKNFDIDLEDLIGYEDKDPGLFGRLLLGKFTIEDNGEFSEFTHPLHDRSLPFSLRYPEIQSQWNDIHNRITNEILNYKQGVEFAFATYKSVQLPNEVATVTQKILAAAQKQAQPFVSSSSSQDRTSSWIVSSDNTLKLRCRRGLSEPKGFHSPLGWNDEDVRTFQTLADGKHDFQRWRSKEELKRIYKRDFKSGRFHWGMDISDGCLNDETPVYAVKEGIVEYAFEATSDNAGTVNRWRVLERQPNGTWSRIESVGSVGTDLYDDWQETIENYFGNSSYKNAPVGTILGSVNNPDRLFYVDFKDAGQNITLSHNLGRERSKYLHLSRVLVSTGDRVKPGQVIGYVGKTSRLTTASIVDAGTDSNGNIFDLEEPVDIDQLNTEVVPHLHFEYYERADWHAERNANSQDEIKIIEPSYDAGFVVVDVRPTWEWAASQGYSDYISDNPLEESPTLEVAKAAVQNEEGLSEEDKSALVSALDFMFEQGYFYYDRQEDVTNVWWRPWRISVETVNTEENSFDEVIRHDTAVLTNITGGLRHVVANIPILGHEFPTQQHLGSIEPYYNLEFHLLDDSGTLEGIGERGGILTALRFLLQHNSRKFRLIPDSWCLYTDCFLTRLIGTLQISDLKTAPSPEDDKVISDFILNRRTMISRAQQDTVEGNPGLSRLLWEIQETNPYTQEALELNAPTKTTVEEARKKILNALFRMDFIDEYKDLALKLLIAQAAGANTLDPQDPNFGKFVVSQAHVVGNLDSVAYMNEYSAYALHDAWEKVYSDYNTAARVQHGEESSRESKVFVLRDDNRLMYDALRAQGIPVTSFNGSIVESQPGNTYVAIPEYAIGLEEYKTDSKENYYTVYDLSAFLNQSQKTLLMGEIPIGKIQTLGLILKNILTSAEMYLTEDSSLLEEGSIEGSALPKSKIQKDLYDLPIEPRLLRTFQNYITNTAAYFYFPELTGVGIGISSDTISASPAKALSQHDQIERALEGNDNWLVWKENAKLSETTLRGEVSWWGTINSTFDVLTLGIGPAIMDSLGRAWHGMKNSGRAFTSLAAGDLPKLESYWAATYNENFESINSSIVKGYVRALPLITLSASETIKDIIEDSVFGDLLGGLVGDSGLPAIANTQTRLTKALKSSGYFGPHPWISDIPFFLEPNTIVDKKIQDIDFSVDGSGNLIVPTVEGAGQHYKTKPVSYAQAVLEAIPVPYIGSAISNVFLSNEELFDQAGVPLPGSSFVWDIDTGIEEEKVRYFKQLLARLADSCLAEPGVLKAFGLEGLAYLDRTEFAKGREAYPDLDLPYHPYYGTSYSVHPDFYMWNMYEDGDVFNSAVRKEVSAGMGTILTNCYNSLKKLQGDSETGENAYRPSRNKAIQDPNIDDTVSLNIKYNAEGTEGMATPFYPSDVSKGAIEDFYSGLSEKVTSSKSNASNTATSDADTGIDSDSSQDNAAFDIDIIEQLSSIKPNGIRLENGAGYYGAGAGLQYPTRLSGSQYKELIDKVGSVSRMFGSRAGYVEETSKKKELPEQIQKRLDGTPLERDLQPSHEFDLNSLKQLAENCSNDLFSQKRRMARAFPTFKLYFIEEDEWETRLLNFDDFYSYNAVKDFTVTMSRKTPGDVAVVTLQNVAGVLDGTKRDAVADLDYFSTKMKAKVHGDNPVTAGTIDDQPFGALVLRPGLNVQLRAGYSNDPDNLTVLINGRVVDVQWNQQGDTAQIMIQSFGTELLQVLKGTEPESSDIFYTTHQLLGSLMLEPELQHFGRWEIGQMFQTGEASDYRFDFNDYSKEAHFGRFEYSSAAVKWFFRHPVVLYGLALGGIAASSRIPGASRLFGSASRWGTRLGFVNKIATKLGIVGTVGAGGFEKELISTAGSTLVTSGRRSAFRAGTIITAESDIPVAAVQSVFKRYGASWAERGLGILSRESPDYAAALSKRNSEILARGLEWITAGGTATRVPVKQAAEALAIAESEMALSIFKGGWMSNPLGTATGIEMIKDIGRRPLSNILSGSFGGVSKVIGGAATAGLAIDVATWTGIPKDLYDATLGRAQKYFAATQVSLMLSPQDDNLFPPHPKDYMMMNQTLGKQFKRWISYVGASAISGNEVIGNLVSHYFNDEGPFDKRVPVETCQYKVNNSYIWDVLYEMSLRHPGWIYGIRPYGKKFRYTIFFGVPSQRYWSVPADNLFIERANKVQRMLKGDITVEEYRSLYGDTIGSEDLSDFDLGLQLQAEGFSKNFYYTNMPDRWETKTYAEGRGLAKKVFDTWMNDGIDPGERTYQKNTQFVKGATADEQQEKVYQDKLQSLRVATYTGRALEEYLRALNLRFVPFRRYHSVSSEIDLVWNGIIGSENAAYNAVDVTYFSEDPDSSEPGPEGSALVKAHAFLPESKLRVKPLQPYTNCRGYTMAMRYGMGELAMSLREMYRGEIITLGNPRIMPWDIIILQDTYNSMVGPIEVEQVVHNFSHETGFITEIKPGAVVLANETSSWPLLEAMKLASMAVRNVENDALGMTADSFGSALGVVEWIADTGPGGNNPQYQDYAKRKMKEIFGENWDAQNQKFIPDSDLSKVLFNKNISEAKTLEKISQTVDKIEDTASGIVDGLAVIGGLSSVGLGLLAWRHKLPFGPKVAAPTGLLAKAGLALDTTIASGGMLASGLVLASDAMIDPPQLMSLLGGSLLMLQCLKGDSIMVVPLMKNGYPIAAGLNYHDPTMIWKNFLGDLGRFADDVLGGTRELADLWSIYGMYAWRRLPEWDSIKTDEANILTGVNMNGGI